MARPRKYPFELLDRGARVVIESNRPIAHVARDLGLPSETLRRYVRQVEADQGLRPDLPTAAEREEIRQLSGCWRGSRSCTPKTTLLMAIASCGSHCGAPARRPAVTASSG